MCEKCNAQRLLRLKQVQEKIPLSKPEIYRRLKNGTFPQSVRLSQSVVAWVESELDAWIESRMAERISSSVHSGGE